MQRAAERIGKGENEMYGQYQDDNLMLVAKDRQAALMEESRQHRLAKDAAHGQAEKPSAWQRLGMILINLLP